MNYNELTRLHFEVAAQAGVFEAGINGARVSSVSSGGGGGGGDGGSGGGGGGSGGCGSGVTAAGRVCRGSAGSRENGTWVQFEVKITLINQIDTVESARFLAFGCPHVIAVCDWLAESAVGAPASRQLLENVAGLQARFAMPTEKLGRLLVIEDAWSAAMPPHIL